MAITYRCEARFMARLDLTRFGIAMDAAAFKELLHAEFHGHYRSIGSVDELLVRPREALHYCDVVRKELANKGEAEAYDLPDDVILRALLGLRKHG